jgi:hypothetical protein
VIAMGEDKSTKSGHGQGAEPAPATEPDEQNTTGSAEGNEEADTASGGPA